VPGVGLLAIGSPLFTHASVAIAHHRRLTISTGAHVLRHYGKKGKKVRRITLSPARAPYIESLRIDGHPYIRPWTTYCALSHGANLTFQLGTRPDRRWGAGAAAAPASFGPNHAMPTHSCAP
jgi:putative alpha-1,2-mannosidase